MKKILRHKLQRAKQRLYARLKNGAMEWSGESESICSRENAVKTPRPQAILRAPKQQRRRKAAKEKIRKTRRGKDSTKAQEIAIEKFFVVENAVENRGDGLQ